MLGNRKLKTTTFVLPSGVSATVRGMKALDQSHLSQGVNGLSNFVASCLISLGNKTLPNTEGLAGKELKKVNQKRLAIVNNLLLPDFRTILCYIRLTSQKHREDSSFPCEIDWSYLQEKWEKEGNEYPLKTQDRYVLDMKEIIEAPFPWVEVNENGEFEECFEDYKEMYNEKKDVLFSYVEDETTHKLKITLPTVKKEIQTAKKGITHPALLALDMFYLCQEVEIPVNPNTKETKKVFHQVPLDQLEPEQPLQIVNLISPFSAKINTSFEAEHPQSGDKQEIDIIMTPDFFMLGQVNS